jgi:hypothetical protein
MLLIDHIKRIRQHVYWRTSVITIYVEHNLGFEAEHHERALRGCGLGVKFHYDHQRQRVGILTTLSVKHAMCTLTNTCLRENRLFLHNNDLFVSRDCKGMKIRLKEQLQIYSYQYKG